VLIGQVLGHVADQSQRWRSHFYFNEDTEQEHLIRLAARMARVPKGRIETRQLSDEERGRLVKVMDMLQSGRPFGMTDCTGWTAEEVVRDIIHRRWDVVGVDGLGQFPGARRREELEEISRILNQAAKPARGNCHILLAHHLNRSRVGQSMVLPFPALGDIRDSSRLSDDADSVLFVYRDQDEDTGEPLASGLLRFAKGRGHRLGGMHVTFEGDFQRFAPGAFDAQRWQQEAAAA
jgi:replicative DNA helicase